MLAQLLVDVIGHRASSPSGGCGCSLGVLGGGEQLEAELACLLGREGDRDRTPVLRSGRACEYEGHLLGL